MMVLRLEGGDGRAIVSVRDAIKSEERLNPPPDPAPVLELLLVFP